MGAKLAPLLNILIMRTGEGEFRIGTGYWRGVMVEYDTASLLV